MRSPYEYLIEEYQSQLKYRFKEKYQSLYSKVPHFFKPEYDILVVSMCGAKKDPKARNEKIPARELFLGPANQTLLEVLPNLKVDWIIFSGGWGLLKNTTKINYYTDVIMDLSDETLKELKDFCKYEEDLIRIIKAGHYKKIIFTLSETWMIMLDMNKIAEAAGEKCELIGFLTSKLLNDEDYHLPKTFINVDIKDSYLQKFESGYIAIKEHIVTKYLERLESNPNLKIETFVKNYEG